MSEKRFKLNDKGSFILEDDEPLKPLGKVVDLLNTFAEENELLRKTVKMWGGKYGDSYNECLTMSDEIERLEIENGRLKEENEQLKSRVECLESMFHDILMILSKDDKFKKIMRDELKEFVELEGLDKLLKELKDE